MPWDSLNVSYPNMTKVVVLPVFHDAKHYGKTNIAPRLGITALITDDEVNREHHLRNYNKLTF